MTLYTIGHSNLLFGEFHALLREHGIHKVIDVRSSPFSRHSPQFSKTDLAASLEAAGIAYVFEGRSIGGRPEDPDCYRHRAVPAEGTDYLQEVDYAAVMRKPLFLEGIERLLIAASEGPAAVMCSEADPRNCHRHHLIATYLNRAHPSVEVVHIVQGGTYPAKDLPSIADQPTADQLELF